MTQILHPLPIAQLPLYIFLDLDGVFADFNKKFQDLSGTTPEKFLETRKKGHFWGIIHQCEDFFETLELMNGSDKLWSATRDYSPIFLTGAPSKKTFQEQKVRWVAKHFGHEHQVIVLPKKEKAKYASPRSILIDDTPANISDWSLAGGLPVHHTGDFNKTIAKLDAHLIALKEV